MRSQDAVMLRSLNFGALSLILENRYGLKPNQNLVLSGNYSLTDYRTDSTFTSAEDKNNEARGFAVGYEYFFNQNNNIKIKYGFNDYDAKLDSYGYDNEYQRISYSTRIKNINFNLSQTINYNTYDKADTFVNLKADTILYKQQIRQTKQHSSKSEI